MEEERQGRWRHWDAQWGCWHDDWGWKKWWRHYKAKYWEKTGWRVWSEKHKCWQDDLPALQNRDFQIIAAANKWTPGGSQARAAAKLWAPASSRVHSTATTPCNKARSSAPQGNDAQTPTRRFVYKGQSTLGRDIPVVSAEDHEKVRIAMGVKKAAPGANDPPWEEPSRSSRPRDELEDAAPALNDTPREASPHARSSKESKEEDFENMKVLMGWRAEAGVMCEDLWNHEKQCWGGFTQQDVPRLNAEFASAATPSAPEHASLKTELAEGQQGNERQWQEKKAESGATLQEKGELQRDRGAAPETAADAVGKEPQEQAAVPGGTPQENEKLLNATEQNAAVSGHTPQEIEKSLHTADQSQHGQNAGLSHSIGSADEAGPKTWLQHNAKATPAWVGNVIPRKVLSTPFEKGVAKQALHDLHTRKPRSMRPNQAFQRLVVASSYLGFVPDRRRQRFRSNESWDRYMLLKEHEEVRMLTAAEVKEELQLMCRLGLGGFCVFISPPNAAEREKFLWEFAARLARELSLAEVVDRVLDDNEAQMNWRRLAATACADDLAAEAENEVEESDSEEEQPRASASGKTPEEPQTRSVRAAEPCEHISYLAAQKLNKVELEKRCRVMDMFEPSHTPSAGMPITARGQPMKEKNAKENAGWEGENPLDLPSPGGQKPAAESRAPDAASSTSPLGRKEATKDPLIQKNTDLHERLLPLQEKEKHAQKEEKEAEKKTEIAEGDGKQEEEHGEGGELVQGKVSPQRNNAKKKGKKKGKKGGRKVLKKR